MLFFQTIKRELVESQREKSLMGHFEVLVNLGCDAQNDQIKQTLQYQNVHCITMLNKRMFKI
ncbi:hypothetical protein BpHYR1_020511 [Brachionus plicatilis]|uniref:Uncharacterized protein n=1 Tax=Brachionus plicatilis TaxID=10195 RepID=A0A3M7SU68_BRAPC|nr:hypothetical protein BpHYR1_020511 [Brachionus plicatilis]